MAETAGGYKVIPGAEVDVETGAVTVDGERIQDAVIVTRQYLPLYPQAAGLHRAWPWRARKYERLFDYSEGIRCGKLRGTRHGGMHRKVCYSTRVRGGEGDGAGQGPSEQMGQAQPQNAVGRRLGCCPGCLAALAVWLPWLSDPTDRAAVTGRGVPVAGYCAAGRCAGGRGSHAIFWDHGGPGNCGTDLPPGGLCPGGAALLCIWSGI